MGGNLRREREVRISSLGSSGYSGGRKEGGGGGGGEGREKEEGRKDCKINKSIIILS